MDRNDGLGGIKGAAGVEGMVNSAVSVGQRAGRTGVNIAAGAAKGRLK